MSFRIRYSRFDGKECLAGFNVRAGQRKLTIHYDAGGSEPALEFEDRNIAEAFATVANRLTRSDHHVVEERT